MHSRSNEPMEETTNNPALDGPERVAADQHAYEQALVEQKLREEMPKEEVVDMPSTYVGNWSMSGPIMACLLVIAFMVVAVVASRSLNNWIPANKPAPTSGVVVQQTVSTPEAIPAYPTVYVQRSADPTMTPSPLPPAQEKKKGFFGLGR